jgi:hypothetical protein
MSAMVALLFLVFPVQITADDAAKDEASKDNKKWVPLFDGKTLDGWSVPKYEAEDGKNAEIKDGIIIIGRDDLASGIKYDKPFPKSNYEIMYQAKRAGGYDFFGTITFPVKESHCSFVNGGWSGSVIGLSSINGYDASENETTSFYTFKDKQWYQFRVCVSDDRIAVWVAPVDVDKDGKTIEAKKDDPKTPAATQAEIEKPKIDIVLDGNKKISTRLEVTFFKPLGISTWNTEGHIRDIKYRELTPEEIEEIKDQTGRSQQENF